MYEVDCTSRKWWAIDVTEDSRAARRTYNTDITAPCRETRHKVYIPVLNINQSMGCIGHAVDRNFDLPRPFRLRICSDGGDDFLHRNDRTKNIRTSGERNNARFRRDQTQKLVNLKADGIRVFWGGGGCLPILEDGTAPGGELLPWANIC